MILLHTFVSRSKIPMEVPESTNALELVHTLYSSVEKGDGLILLTKIGQGTRKIRRK